MTPEYLKLKSNFVDVFDASSTPEVLTLAGELSNRKYYRIFVKKPTDNLTPSYVLQAAESFTNPAEHPFLIAQQIFSEIGILVPKIFGVAGQAGWILVEDCGDFFLQYRQELALYRQAMSMLYALAKATGPDAYPLSDILKQAPHWKWAFDFEKLHAEMQHTEKFFVKGLLKEKVVLAEALAENSHYLAQRDRVLCHRDFHSRNLLVKNDELYALDFQDARMGPVTYDLVSLLWDPYANLKAGVREVLLSEWKNTLGFGDEINEEIHRMKIQRLLKAIGSYSSFYLDKGNPSCFVFIEGALGDSIVSFNELEKLGSLSAKETKLAAWLRKIHKQVVLG